VAHRAAPHDGIAPDSWGPALHRPGADGPGGIGVRQVEPVSCDAHAAQRVGRGVASGACSACIAAFQRSSIERGAGGARHCPASCLPTRTACGRADPLPKHGRKREGESFSRSIDIRIGRLRRKVEPDPQAGPRCIRTVHLGGRRVVPMA